MKWFKSTAEKLEAKLKVKDKEIYDQSKKTEARRKIKINGKEFKRNMGSLSQAMGRSADAVDVFMQVLGGSRNIGIGNEPIKPTKPPLMVTDIFGRIKKTKK